MTRISLLMSEEKSLRIETIFFDVGNTLTFPNWQEVLMPLHDLGITVATEELHRAERHAKRSVDLRVSHSAKVDSDYWSLFFEVLLQPFKNCPSNLQGELVQRVRSSRNWSITKEGTRDVLDTLRARYRLGVVSNSDGEVEAALSVAGIREYFEVIVDSGIVGVEKPSPEIFHHAIAAIGTTIERSIYIGDVWSIDIVGARNIGMEAILYDASQTYLETDIKRIESLGELLPLFNLLT